MIKKSVAEKFLFKVDMEGLDYAVENYAPEKTGDAKFDKLIKTFRSAMAELNDYVEEIREEYNIPVN